MAQLVRLGYPPGTNNVLADYYAPRYGPFPPPRPWVSILGDWAAADARRAAAREANLFLRSATLGAGRYLTGPEYDCVASVAVGMAAERENGWILGGVATRVLYKGLADWTVVQFPFRRPWSAADRFAFPSLRSPLLRGPPAAAAWKAVSVAVWYVALWKPVEVFWGYVRAFGPLRDLVTLSDPRLDRLRRDTLDNLDSLGLQNHPRPGFCGNEVLARLYQVGKEGQWERLAREPGAEASHEHPGEDGRASENYRDWNTNRNSRGDQDGSSNGGGDSGNRSRREDAAILTDGGRRTGSDSGSGSDSSDPSAYSQLQQQQQQQQQQPASPPPPFIRDSAWDAPLNIIADNDKTSNDASPVAPSAGPAGESAWDRIRSRTHGQTAQTAQSHSWEEQRWPEQANESPTDGQRNRESRKDRLSGLRDRNSSGEYERLAGRERARKEFDEMLESERNGGAAARKARRRDE